ncbi:cytochrome c oxidase subunit 4 isoform 1, mitochondrial-like [Lucilia cuprina]|uniref:cytochrome c oxidase subunit 4 isoform 1, mitochondrial-like n=1 Tax=Lucilia cuprina TaxID=7375 RepID=UPI001F064F04|nr:cytochrome c oxidase subunit 4 isoform 1, mitochondrial-like [Lucilia cuprina]
MALQISKLISRQQLWKSIKSPPLTISKRATSHDYTNTMCGKREYVGFGVNGAPIYVDLVDFPMPAIRFQEPSPEICALRKKEEEDWKKLSKDEIKRLYRYSFCRTFAEMKAPTGEWKLHLGIALWACTIGLLFCYTVNVYHQDLPDTFAEDRRQAQLKRIIALEMNPITGLASKWDYEVGDWK